MTAKSNLPYDYEVDNADLIGRSYQCFCLEQALVNILQARAVVADHNAERELELPKIEKLIRNALETS